MANEKKEQAVVFEEAQAKFNEAQHKLIVELTHAKYADLYQRKSFVDKQIAQFQVELADIEKDIKKLSVEGVEAM